MTGTARSLWLVACAATVLVAGGCAAMMPAAPVSTPLSTKVSASGPVHAVYQLDGNTEKASLALRSIRNHLQVDPQAKLTVVALGEGVDFLLQGAMDKGGYPFELTVADLAEQGVVFEACANTLQARGIDPRRLIDHVSLVPAGFAEIARLQWQLRYAYIRP